MQAGALHFGNPARIPKLQNGALQFGNPVRIPKLQNGALQFGNPARIPKLQVCRLFSAFTYDALGHGTNSHAAVLTVVFCLDQGNQLPGSTGRHDAPP